MADKIRIALIGHGRWGSHLLRNLASNDSVEIIAVVDPNQEHRARAKKQYGVSTFESHGQMMEREQPDAVVIATNPEAHYQLAKYFLEKNCHVLVEKPITYSVKECEDLVAIAEDKKLSLMVDHTYLYTPEIRNLKTLISQNELGVINHYDSIRSNRGSFRPHSSALWDLGPHDISILDYLLDAKLPEKVMAVGRKHFGRAADTLCYLTLFYDKDFVAHCHLNWGAPDKIRRLFVSGDKKTAAFDDCAKAEKIKVFDESILVDMSEAKYEAPVSTQMNQWGSLEQKEALESVICEFIDSIKSSKIPLSGAQSALRVIKILEAAAKSSELNGEKIAIQ